MEQAAKKQSMSEKDLEKFIEKTDQHKADYYRYYTGGEKNDAVNIGIIIIPI